VFSLTSRVMAAGSVIGDIALGDMDQDGDLDLVVGRFAKYTSINSDARDHIWFNDGHGRFLQSTVIGSDTASLRIALGDLDQDGDLDIVCTTGEGGQFRSVQGPSKCYINQGDGTFSESRIHSSNPNFNMRMDSLALGDINHDGHLDLVQKDRDGIIHLWHNRGDGSFLYGHYLVTRHFNNSIVGLYDVDADGDLDMYLSGCGQHVRNYVRWNR